MVHTVSVMILTHNWLTLGLGVNYTEEDESEDLGLYVYETGKLMIDLG